jgi:hypothetical protein
MSHALVRLRRADTGLLDLESFARSAQLHPDLVRRLVTLGLLEAERDAAGGLWFHPGELAALARIKRLRASFSINYAALGLVVDLLDRIAELEAAARTSSRGTPRRPSQGPSRPTGGRSWTPTA